MIAGPAGDDADERERCNQNSSTAQDEEDVDAVCNWGREGGGMFCHMQVVKVTRKEPKFKEFYIAV